MILLDADEWMNYLGHFHPVVVHLPIGILFVAFILEFIGRKPLLQAALRPAVLVILAAGCISAIISCLFGWFLSMDGGYEEKTLLLHQWLGICVALIAGLCWWLKIKYGSIAKAGSAYQFSLILLFVLLMATGHFGGSMTHGDDYLTAGLPQPFAKWFGVSQPADTSKHVRKAIPDIAHAIVYTDLIQPVLDEKCYSCHSAKKIKGGLRMDKDDMLFKGGKHGAVIKPGDAAGSEMMVRILLPKDDDKRMPPKDKKAMTKQETELLRWWIQNGASTTKKVSELPRPAVMAPVLASFAAPAEDTVKITPLSVVFDKNPPPANQADINALTQLGVLVAPVAKGSNLLDISCINYTAFNNSHMPLLMKLAQHITLLKLDNTMITDDALQQVAQFQNLVRLHLAETNITAAGIKKLQPLAHLEYVNLVHTKLNDEGLMALCALPALKHVYCWNTLVTKNGIDQFKQKKPGVRLDGGSISK